VIVERHPQQRAIETRAAILDAAVECLIELGYAATTTPEIARRAGVSRGAQLHHFPTKAELMAAAVGRLLDRRLGEFRQAFAGVVPGPDTTDHALGALWSMFEGQAFTAWAEVWVAARTDTALRDVVIAMDRRFYEEAAAIYADLFPGEQNDGFALDFVFTVMGGMAIQRLLPASGGRPAADYLNVLKLLADTFGHQGPPPTEIGARQ
jgi:AcrR family transcriptional regulator